MKPALELLHELRRRRGLHALPGLPPEPSPEPPPEVRPAVCGYFWGIASKGSCARCGHTYREHLDLVGEARE